MFFRNPTCTHCLKTLRDSLHTILTQFRYFDAILKPNSDLYFSVLLLFWRAGSTSLMNVNLKTQFRYPGITQPNILKLHISLQHTVPHTLIVAFYIFSYYYWADNMGVPVNSLFKRQNVQKCIASTWNTHIVKLYIF